MKNKYLVQLEITKDWIIYLASCKAHSYKYVGQTYDQRGFVGRHYGHRQDCQSGIVGLAKHFYQQHGGCKEEMEVVIIDSVLSSQATMTCWTRRKNNGFNG